MFKRKWQIVFWFIVLAPSLAPAQDLQSFAPNFLKKVVTLRNFYRSDSLQYDSSGTLVSNSGQGPWTVYGILEIARFQVSNNKVEIGASRLLVVYDPKSPVPTYVKWEPHMKIQIDLPPNASVADLNRAMGRVFVTASEKLSDLVPAYWQNFLAAAEQNASPRSPALPKESSKSANGGAPPQPGTEVTPAPNLALTPAPDAQAPTKVRVSQGVIPGHLISHVNPRYPELAKLARVSGAVVIRAIIGKDGHLAELQVMHPVGAGIDDAAVEAVSQWRYQPYLLKGEPVEVDTEITVNFVLGG